ncbi:protein mono-ADP-ribosyltransferase PARP9-like [Neolamprologus brichardi]|uniref:protein mono-ADP-ribosyltransferase PARP9-like n=1 Tax=Neolamprologus brichardi TaxID=32507 RepID=UPI0003EBD45A|nr:protein mono-ADP-ribosyltransferase PARP9-like [Neolamprologus brichardi]XP_006793754.1 protein mono-ADP-ribosyltransferase PARP9-like [Neolamprologus brichardi]
MAHTSDIVLHESSLNIVKQSRSALSHILERKFGCEAAFKGVDFESDVSFGQQKRQTVAPEKRFSVKLRAGVEVSVWKADLTNFTVKAVVNAANSNLHHGGGLAYALCEAGGPQIQIECDDYTHKHGSIPTGEAIVTNAGMLPCKKIIHAVGPCLPIKPTHSEFSLAKRQLEQAIRSILDRVEKDQLDTVAIPAISSGLFNYPLSECAETIVSTVRDYYEFSSSRWNLPREILFVNHDEPTVTEMMNACHKILAPHQHYQLAPQGQAPGTHTSGATKTSNISIQIRNVLLALKSDNIEEQKTDVIVNTTSLERDLKVGQVSKALLKKAGQKMQDEIENAPRTKHIIVTKAYNLGCREVYHTFCINNGKEAAHKFLFNSVLECLQTAAASQHKSVAFPAIGTGNLGFTKKEAACIMSEAVVEFAKQFGGKMEIYFVIFPSDYGTFQAFKEKIKSLQHNTPHTSITQDEVKHFSSHRQAYDNKEDFRFNKAPIPKISLRSYSKESLHEAEKWLTHFLIRPPRPMVIYNNFIQHLGEREYLQLSHLTRKGVKCEEFLSKGHACLTVDGDSAEDVVDAALQAEAMLCTVQEAFVREEKDEMCKLLAEVPRERERKTKTVDNSSREFKERISDFRNLGLWILKVDKVENSNLKKLFDLKKNQLGCSSEKMFQRIPAQFCEMVSQIGSHAECAPPEDPKYGEGIYFAGTVKEAMDVWKEEKDKYLYFVEADVLRGTPTEGQRGLILPPAKGTDPQVRFDSVSGGSNISVIFSSYQALPRYIITCEKKQAHGYPK